MKTNQKAEELSRDYDDYHLCRLDIEYACVDMAEWMKKRMIDKVTKLIAENTHTVNEAGRYFVATNDGMNQDDFICMIKKAMEEIS